MIHRFLIRCCGIIYQFIAKPILFKFSPDKVHEDMLKFCRFFGSWSLLRSLTRIVFKRHHASIRQEYHNIVFESPVGVAAGFDKNGDTVPVVSNLGFGFMEVGSVTALSCTGNPKPWFQRLPKSQSLAVHVGLANQGSYKVIQRLENYGRQIRDFPVILSIAKTNNKESSTDEAAIKDYVASITRAAGKSSIKMIEINISCPNTYGGEPFTDVHRLGALLDAIDDVHVSQPVFIKMPNDLSWKKQEQLLDVIVKHNIQGVTVSNLSKSRKNVKDAVSNEIKGGLSGKLAWNKSNELIKNTYLRYGKRLTIIGVGGIFTAEDAYIKIRLGASLVELITGMIFQGPQIAAEINAELPKLLKNDGFSHISEAIGIDAK